MESVVACIAFSAMAYQHQHHNYDGNHSESCHHQCDVDDHKHDERETADTSRTVVFCTHAPFEPSRQVHRAACHPLCGWVNQVVSLAQDMRVHASVVSVLKIGSLQR